MRIPKGASKSDQLRCELSLKDFRLTVARDRGNKFTKRPRKRGDENFSVRIGKERKTTDAGTKVGIPKYA